VDSGLVARVFGLIRLQGPSESAHYLEFLAALCQCSGAPKRHNQRLIANQLAEVGAIMRLYYDEGDDHTLGMGIMICGDHPKLQRPEGLASWLKRMKLGGDEPLVAFLESLLSLCAVLVAGRNVKCTALLREWMPYEPLIFEAITDKALVGTQESPGHLSVVRRFVQLAQVLYVDNAPHAVMAQFMPVRIWDSIEDVAASGKVASQQTTVMEEPVNWQRFDKLKDFVCNFLRPYKSTFSKPCLEPPIPTARACA
jgi:hypothetical protein